ncbi:HTH_Tnp_Tc3_2 domain-containing protein [Trichonephila clavipes]|nr:HTH_Tnp_Tc3_2 domain-containing protein [Trichonephila clavipes]
MTDLSRVRKRYDCWNEVRWLLGDGNSHLFRACKGSTVSAVMTAYKKCGNVTSDKHNSGRKRKLTDRDKRVLTRIVARKRKQSLSQITSEVNSHLRNPISSRIVQRELHASNLYGRVGISKPLVTARHALQRRQWCRTHRPHNSGNKSSGRMNRRSPYSKSPDAFMCGERPKKHLL